MYIFQRFYAFMCISILDGLNFSSTIQASHRVHVLEGPGQADVDVDDVAAVW